MPWPLQLIPAKPHILPLVRLVEAIRAGWVRRDARRATMTSKSAGGVIAVAAGQPVMSVRVDFYLLDVAFPALCLSAGECPLAF